MNELNVFKVHGTGNRHDRHYAATSPHSGSIPLVEFDVNVERFQVRQFGQKVTEMLTWYRSRDLEKVTAATHWFASLDIQAHLRGLIDELQGDDLGKAERAKDGLAAFSELALKTVVTLLDDVSLHREAVEILARMDSYVLPHLLRWLDKSDSYNVRIGIYRALTGHLPDYRAARAIAEGLRSPDRLEAAAVFETLMGFGPKGHRIVESVFERVECLVA